MKGLTEIGGTHYEKKKYQPIQLIVELNLNFFQGNIIKYLTRYKDKNGAEDLHKALHYSQLGNSLHPTNNACIDYKGVQQVHTYCAENNLSRIILAILMYVLHQNWSSTCNLIEELIHREYE